MIFFIFSINWSPARVFPEHWKNPILTKFRAAQTNLKKNWSKMPFTKFWPKKSLFFVDTRFTSELPMLAPFLGTFWEVWPKELRFFFACLPSKLVILAPKSHGWSAEIRWWGVGEGVESLRKGVSASPSKSAPAFNMRCNQCFAQKYQTTNGFVWLLFYSHRAFSVMYSYLKLGWANAYMMGL